MFVDVILCLFIYVHVCIFYVCARVYVYAMYVCMGGDSVARSVYIYMREGKHTVECTAHTVHISVYARLEDSAQAHSRVHAHRNICARISLKVHDVVQVKYIFFTPRWGSGLVWL